MTHHNIHPNNDSQTRPLPTLTFFASVRVNQFHTPVYPLRITSQNIPENFPKNLPHNVHNASSIHSPLPSCCCRQESRTSSATRSNVKISFLTRIPKIESSAKSLPECDEHQLHIGRRLAGDQHPMKFTEYLQPTRSCGSEYRKQYSSSKLKETLESTQCKRIECFSQLNPKS